MTATKKNIAMLTMCLIFGKPLRLKTCSIFWQQVFYCASSISSLSSGTSLVSSSFRVSFRFSVRVAGIDGLYYDVNINEK